MQNGYELSQRHEVRIFGNVTEKYGTGKWYVEGVGKSVNLLAKKIW